MLTRQQARDFYDRFGRRQDRQSFYERRPIDRMVELGDFGSAEAVVEFGCGTGAFAQRLMDEELPGNATYAGFDLSETMTKMTRRRLVPYGARVSVTRTDGRPRIPLPPDSCDRFVSNYVLDLLPIGDITRTLDQAYKVLRPDGLLCLTSLTFGTNALSKLTIAVWLAVHSLKPSLVGGCRPISLSDYLGPASWKVLYSTTVIAFGVPTQVLIAQPRGHGQDQSGTYNQFAPPNGHGPDDEG
jgi:ubiquinone/menaquinone biosynthesis C-methylase UbiE